jgi:hypothetical protein
VAVAAVAEMVVVMALAAAIYCVCVGWGAKSGYEAAATTPPLFGTHACDVPVNGREVQDGVVRLRLDGNRPAPPQRVHSRGAHTYRWHRDAPPRDSASPLTSTHTHAHRHKVTKAHRLTRSHTRTHAHKHACTHAHKHACTHARTHACTHARTYACTHARTTGPPERRTTGGCTGQPPGQRRAGWRRRRAVPRRASRCRTCGAASGPRPCPGTGPREGSPPCCWVPLPRRSCPCRPRGCSPTATPAGARCGGDEVRGTRRCGDGAMGAVLTVQQRGTKWAGGRGLVPEMCPPGGA